MKKPSTKKQIAAGDKKQTKHDNMENDIKEVGIQFFLDGAKMYGNVSFTFPGYVNFYLNTLAVKYISENYGSMGNTLLKINARLVTGIYEGYEPLSVRTIRRIFKDHEDILSNRGVVLHLIP